MARTAYQMEGGQGNTTDTDRSNLLFVFLLPCSQPVHRVASMAISDGRGPGKYHRYIQKELVFCTPSQLARLCQDEGG